MERSRERERKDKWRLKEKKEWLGGLRKNWSPDATVDPAAGRRC